MSFKHSYMVITTNFELEPVLDSYLKTYPNGDFSTYQVMFKSLNERAEGEISYIIVLEPKQGEIRDVKFHHFLKSHCTLHRLTASASILNNVFPTLSDARQAHYFGLPPAK